MFSDDPRDDLMMEKKAHFLKFAENIKIDTAKALNTNPTKRNQHVY